MINIENLSKNFGDLNVYDKFNLNIHTNKVTTILGPSGCGKTTLLNLISGTLKLDQGNIHGIDNSKLSYLFQEPRLLPWLSVEDNIKFVLNTKDSIISEKINKYLNMVDMTSHRNSFPMELSGGMMQRVAIARAFAVDSNILLMDEPFKSLDFELKLNLVNIFKKLWTEDHRTVVLVTHDVQIATLISDEIIIFSKQPICAHISIENKIPPQFRTLNNPDLLALQSKIYRELSLK